VVIGKSLAVEWVDFARANTVSPGFIESGLTGAVSEEIKDTLRAKTPLKSVDFVPSIIPT
jgi:sorbose reductase